VVRGKKCVSFDDHGRIFFTIKKFKDQEQCM